MKKIFFTFLIGVIISCGLIVGIGCDEKCFVVKKLSSVKLVVASVLKAPLNILSKIVFYPVEILKDAGASSLSFIKKMAAFPAVYIGKRYSF